MTETIRPRAFRHPVDMSLIRKILGSRGERIAARHLKGTGCRILARNFACPMGELDLVAQHKASGTVIFVEVKTRRDESVARAEQAVGRTKQRHIVGAARFFIKQRRLPPDTPLRFDVVAITFDAQNRPQVRHTPSAFRA